MFDIPVTFEAAYRDVKVIGSPLMSFLSIWNQVLPSLIDAITQTLVEQGFSQPVREYEEKLLDVGMKVRYLYEPGELGVYQYKGERRKRSTDPIWSVDVYKIKDRYVQKHQPTLYYLDAGPKRSFVFEELQPIHDP